MLQSLIGTLRAYLIPHVQRQQTVAGVQRVYALKTDDSHHRVHWEFRKEEVKTPLGKLGMTKGRPMPDDFELSLLAIRTKCRVPHGISSLSGKRSSRTVDGQGRISIKRYRWYVRIELKRTRVEIREFFDSLVVISQSGAVVSDECAHERSQMASVKNTPVFHEHPGIETSPKLERCDVSQFRLRYVIPISVSNATFQVLGDRC